MIRSLPKWAAPRFLQGSFRGKDTPETIRQKARERFSSDKIELSREIDVRARKMDRRLYHALKGHSFLAAIEKNGDRLRALGHLRMQLSSGPGKWKKDNANAKKEKKEKSSGR